MAIPTYRLPPGIESKSSGGPDFRSIVLEATSGREQRVITWAKCRASYDIAYSVLASSDPLGNYRAVYALFMAHFGKAYAFRFKDWLDYQATDEVFGVGDGATTQFRLTKTYDPGYLLTGSSGPLTYTRDIVLPVAAGLVINNNGTPTTAYTLDAGGLVTFTTAPATGDGLTWTGEFDLPVRFDTDHLPVVMNEADLVKISSIPLRELIGEY